jgi:urate oxidase
MSNEEMNKKMEFIVEHQAKFAAEIEIMREVQAADSHRFSDALTGTLAIVGNLTKALTRTDESVRLLTDSQRNLAEAHASLTEAQARTEERLNIFINVVERYISGNGGSELRT